MMLSFTFVLLAGSTLFIASLPLPQVTDYISFQGHGGKSLNTSSTTLGFTDVPVHITSASSETNKGPDSTTSMSSRSNKGPYSTTSISSRKSEVPDRTTPAGSGVSNVPSNTTLVSSGISKGEENTAVAEETNITAVIVGSTLSFLATVIAAIIGGRFWCRRPNTNVAEDETQTMDLALRADNSQIQTISPDPKLLCNRVNQINVYQDGAIHNEYHFHFHIPRSFLDKYLPSMSTNGIYETKA